MTVNVQEINRIVRDLRAGLGPLQEGQTVRMGVVQGQKGPEAGTISLD